MKQDQITDQLAAEAATQIHYAENPSIALKTTIIKAAVEKATKELRDKLELTDAAYAELNRQFIESQSRAAHGTSAVADASEPWNDARFQHLAWICGESPDSDGWTTIRNRAGDHIARMPHELACDICRKQSASLVRAASIEHDAAHASEVSPEYRDQLRSNPRTCHLTHGKPAHANDEEQQEGHPQEYGDSN